MTKWAYFVAAAVFASYCLLRVGVPLLPVLGGCALAGAVHWLRKGRGSSGSIAG